MSTTLKKKRRLVSPVRSGESRGLADLANAAKNDPKSFFTKMEAAVDEGKLRFADLNLRDAYEALATIQVPASYLDAKGNSRAIQASAFPVLSGLLMVAELNDAYDAVEHVGDELVTDIEDNKKTTVIARVKTLEPAAQDEVDEGKDFPEIGASEESYEIRHKRFGRRVSITKEMIEENDIPNIVERVNALAEIASDYVEELTLDRVTDRYGSAAAPTEPYVLRPRNGGAEALYTVTVNEPGPRAPLGTRIANNALQTSANLEKARIRLAAMRNDRNRAIASPWSRTVLLVPNGALSAALKVLGSELEPGVLNEKNNWGPGGKFRPKLLSTPKLDDISASDWYMGDFKRQFRRKWKFRVEYVELGENTESYLRARIAFQARFALDVEVGAVDYNRVVQSQA